ncbi:MAG: hypothetical protein LC650_03855 [Actinobacteria bacterium]|nr:hypothetical protein [Actinomycetota bacterium]
MKNTEFHAAYRFYVLGHEAYYRPGTHIHYFGEPNGAGWVAVCRIADMLGVPVVLPEAYYNIRTPIPDYRKKDVGWC